MKTIALCGLDAPLAEKLERRGICRPICFADSMEYRGEVRLIYFLQAGYTCDLAVVAYPGAAGLTACDYLRAQSKTLPILWLCDRQEFLEEAVRLEAGFYYTGPPGRVSDQQILLQIIEQTVRSGCFVPQYKEI